MEPSKPANQQNPTFASLFPSSDLFTRVRPKLGGLSSGAEPRRFDSMRALLKVGSIRDSQGKANKINKTAGGVAHPQHVPKLAGAPALAPGTRRDSRTDAAIWRTCRNRGPCSEGRYLKRLQLGGTQEWEVSPFFVQRNPTGNPELRRSPIFGNKHVAEL